MNILAIDPGDKAQATVMLTLPWPPTVNRYSGHGATRRFLPKPFADYYETVNLIVIASRAAPFKADARLACELYFYPPDRRKRDESNLLKAIDDALQKSHLIDDDYQIERRMMVRKHPMNPGRVEVVLMEIV